MRIVFNIQYNTRFGESLLIHLTDSDTEKERVYGMNTFDGKTWMCQIETAKDERSSAISYYYSVDNAGQEERHEWKTITHRIELNNANTTHMTVYNRWADIPYDSYLYSSAFTDCVNRRPATPVQPCGFRKTLRLIVRAPQMLSGQRLGVVGRGKALGQWKPSNATLMSEHSHNEWTVDLDRDSFDSERAELKFIAFGDKGELLWETGLNRTIDLPKMGDGECVAMEMDQAFFELANEKLAGTLIPVFSLRTEGSFGVGDFGDLKKMIDWVADTHQRVLQVLPINDTTSTHTWTDSYPYSCISIFALHPQYTDLRQLPTLKDKKAAARFADLQKELNALGQIDYERVNNAKIEYLRLVFCQEGQKELKGKDFKEFFARTEHWLVPYAQYCHLRDKNGTALFAQWPDHRQWDEADRKPLSTYGTKAWQEVEFWYYVQFVLDRQMRAAHDYAVARGVVLKGDIPIGVNRNGCDVWHEPQYFNLNSQTGSR